MSGNKYLLDTNIVLHVLGGNQQLIKFLTGVDLFVSVITEIELLAYPSLSQAGLSAINQFLGELEIIGLNNAVKNATIDIRKTSGLKLPDAIIAATAFANGYTLLTSDKAFQRVNGIMVIEY